METNSCWRTSRTHVRTSCVICVFVCESEKEINSFEITVIVFKAYKKSKSPIQKGFSKRRTSNQNMLFSADLFLFFGDRPKNGEGNKGDIEGICGRVTKHTSKKMVKAEVNLN